MIDSLIYAAATPAGAAVLRRDRDFEVMARHSGLVTVL
jgi:predicted nucleic acid-binding protein